VRITVLLSDDEAKKFEAYCEKLGHKKSPLIRRLIREHMDENGFQLQNEMFPASEKGVAQ